MLQFSAHRMFGMGRQKIDPPITAIQGTTEKEGAVEVFIDWRDEATPKQSPNDRRSRAFPAVARILRDVAGRAEPVFAPEVRTLDEN
jgi:hypothetical protein